MDAEKIKDIVKAALNDTLSEKERAKALEDMQAIIAEAKASIDSLTKALEDKDTELAEKEASLATLSEEKEELASSLETKAAEAEDMAAKVENLEADVAEKAAAIETAEASFTDVKSKFDELSNKVLAAEKAERLAVRLSTLEEAGILRKTEASAAKQKEAVNEMSDEEFEAYTEELVELRKEFSDTTPADPNKEVGSLNFESMSEELNAKYKKLGEALAKRSAQ